MQDYSVIDVNYGDIKLYKQEEYLEKGKYLILPASTKNKVIDKLLGTKHTNYRGYSRLFGVDNVPALTYILLGLPYNRKLTEPYNNLKYTYSDRKWQIDVMAEINTHLKNGLQYKKQINAGMGSGKTYLALRLCQIAKKPIVLMPPSLKKTWADEARKHKLPLPECRSYESIKECDFGQYDVVILDEVLKVKNPVAKRTRLVRKMCDNAQIVLGLTGTPMAGKDLFDLRSVNCVVGSQVFPDSDSDFQWSFAKDTETVDHGSGTHVKVLTWHEDMVGYLSNKTMVTVESSVLMKDVPDKVHKVIRCETPQGYQSLLKGAMARNSSHAIAQARQSTDGFLYDDDKNPQWLKKSSKMDQLLELVSSYQSMEPSQSVVIWVNFVASQKRVAEKLTKSGFKVSCLFSGMTEQEMSSNQEEFLSGNSKVLVCSAALSEGLNLQDICSVMVFFSNSYSWNKRQQAIARIYRPGQNKTSFIYDLVCANTLDEDLLEILDEHKNVSEDFVKAELIARLDRIKGVYNV